MLREICGRCLTLRYFGPVEEAEVAQRKDDYQSRSHEVIPSSCSFSCQLSVWQESRRCALRSISPHLEPTMKVDYARRWKDIEALPKDNDDSSRCATPSRAPTSLATTLVPKISAGLHIDLLNFEQNSKAINELKLFPLARPPSKLG